MPCHRTPRPAVNQRGYIACTHCRRRKVKCIAPEPDSPCEECTKRNWQCEYLTREQERLGQDRSICMAIVSGEEIHLTEPRLAGPDGIYVLPQLKPNCPSDRASQASIRFHRPSSLPNILMDGHSTPESCPQVFDLGLDYSTPPLCPPSLYPLDEKSVLSRTKMSMLSLDSLAADLALAGHTHIPQSNKICGTI
ncbi:hypothetical protein FB45DRAFT_1126980 [Roridomyces roridus]|uniref:Zn(2)-C6 fungal-type domain-containing protein n=1 Tax=Roridomyces roridus TaxID=1738132 RepID=A0AAD7FBR0_9AGAR|nr:hypothetical protein FB45DRAFT_1126980 [Roridomyces roridus]